MNKATHLSSSYKRMCRQHAKDCQMEKTTSISNVKGTRHQYEEERPTSFLLRLRPLFPSLDQIIRRRLMKDFTYFYQSSTHAKDMKAPDSFRPPVRLWCLPQRKLQTGHSCPCQPLSPQQASTTPKAPDYLLKKSR